MDKHFEKKREGNNRERIHQEAQEKIDALNIEMAGYYAQFGIQLDRQGHIKPENFQQCRTAEELQRHREYVQKREQMHREQDENSIESELFEHLVPIIFTKIASDRVIAVRTAKYDDLKNGIDTIVINRENGDIVCSIDEIIFSSEATLRKKENRLISVNDKRAYLNYPYHKKEDGSFEPSRFGGDFPLCYLPIPRGIVLKIISQMGGLNEVTDLERKAFNYFIRHMSKSLMHIYEEYQTGPVHHDRYEAAARKIDEELARKTRTAITFLKSLQVGENR